MSIRYISRKTTPTDDWNNFKNGEDGKFLSRACFAALEQDIKEGENLYVVIDVIESLIPLVKELIDFYPCYKIIDSFEKVPYSYGGKTFPPVTYFLIRITSILEELEYRFYYLLYMGVLVRYFSEMTLQNDDKEKTKKLNSFEYIAYTQEIKYLNSNHFVSDDTTLVLTKNFFAFLKDQEKFERAIKTGREQEKFHTYWAKARFDLRQTAITSCIMRELGKK